MTAVESALAEVWARIAAVSAAHEGLRDYALLNVQPETKAEIDASLAAYDAMQVLMLAFTAAAEALIAAHYPNLEPREISKASVDDLQAQLDTLTAARAQFLVNEAATLAIVPGTPEEK